MICIIIPMPYTFLIVVGKSLNKCGNIPVGVHNEEFMGVGWQGRNKTCSKNHALFDVEQKNEIIYQQNGSRNDVAPFWITIEFLEFLTLTHSL